MLVCITFVLLFDCLSSSSSSFCIENLSFMDLTISSERLSLAKSSGTFGSNLLCYFKKKERREGREAERKGGRRGDIPKKIEKTITDHRHQDSEEWSVESSNL